MGIGNGNITESENMAYTNKESFEATESLTNEIIEKVKTFISRRKTITQYSYHKFFEETNVSHTTWDNMRYNKNRSLTLDTAIRLLDKCGYELSIVPKEDKKKKSISYDHPDIIPPIGYYEKRSE